MAKISQATRIIQYIETFGSIDRLTALKELGIFELPARICEIEKKLGYVFNKKVKKAKNRYNDTFRFIEYSFKDVEN